MTRSPYDRRWRNARAAFLALHPLCVYCERIKRTRAATVVDHIEPHKGDAHKFWDRSNWQALCKPCHDAIKQTLERSGNLRGCDARGVPLDAAHHWCAEADGSKGGG